MVEKKQINVNTTDWYLKHYEAGNPTYDNTNQERFLVVGDNGDILGTTPYSDVNAAREKSREELYRYGDTGEFMSKKDLYSTYNIKMSDNGDIEVNAPKSFTDSKYYQEQLKPALLQMSQAQKLNPNTKFAMTSDQNDLRTAQDWVKAQNDSLASMVARHDQINEYKNKIKNEYKADLSDEDAQIAMSSAIKGKDAQGNDITPNGNDRQVIPEAPEFSYFNNLPGYDKDTHTIDYKTLTEAYSNDKLTDEDIIKIKNTVNNWIEATKNNKDGQTPARDLAEMLSFKRYLDNTDASTNFWTGARHAVTDNLMGFMQGVYTTGTAPIRFLTSLIDSDSGVSKEFNKWTKSISENRTLVNRTSGGAAELSNFAGQIMMSIAMGHYGGVALGVAANSVAGATISAIGKVGKIGPSWFNATEYAQGLQAMLAGSRGMELLGKAVNTLQAGGKAAKAAGEVGKLVAETVFESAMMNPELTAKFIRNTNDEEARKYVLEQGVQNAIFFGASAGLRNLNKAVKATELGRELNARATIGAARIKATLNNWTNKFKKVLHLSADDAVEKAMNYKNKLEGVQNLTTAQENKLTRLQKKAGLAFMDEMEHKATKEIAELSFKGAAGDPEAIKNVIEKVNESVSRKMELALLRDHVENQGKSIFNKLTNSDFNPEFKAKYSELFGDKLTALYNAEKASGETLKKAIDLSAFGDGIRGLSKTSTDYIGSIMELKDVDNRLNVVSKDSPLRRIFEKRQSELTEKITNLTERMGEDWVKAADNYAEVLSEYDKAHTALQTQLGLRDAEKLKKLQDSGRFGEEGADYFRIQREAETVGFKFSDKAKKLGDFQEKAVEATREYQDMLSYRIADLLNDANDYARAEYMRHMVDWGYVGVTNKVAGSDFSAFNELNRTKKMFTEAIGGKADYLVSDVFLKHFDTSGLAEAGFNLKNIEGYKKLSDAVENGLDSTIDNILKDKTLTSDVLDNIIKLNGVEGQVENAKKFLATKALSDELSEDVIKKHLDDALFDVALTGADKKELVETMTKEFQDKLDLKIGELGKKLTEEGAESIVSSSGLFDRVQELSEKITGMKETGNMIEIINHAGQHELLEVDPMVASFFNTKINGYTDTYLTKLNRLQSKIFRTGTTVVGGSSYINQWFKDTQNAINLGNLTLTGVPTKEQIETWGGKVAEFLAKEDKATYDLLARKAKETGESLNKLAFNRELDIAKSLTTTSTEASLYQFNKAKKMSELEQGVEKKINQMGDKLGEISDKLETLHNQREVFLRSATATNAYAQAMQMGYSVKQARIYAEFIGNNATTNFGRQLYHLNQLQSSVPYLGAAINGTKSFWRVAALDPIGVSSRIMGGVVLPTYYLIAQSLGSEENRKVYESIPEYEKRGNLVFISNGKKYTIPLPEEVGKLIAPARQMIEKLYGVDKHTFWELAMNDLVGFSPIDMTGFTNIDRNRLIDNGFIGDHIVPGVSRVISQTMPPLVRTGVELATGKDLYTGKPLDTSYTTIDPDTGEPIVMDSKSGGLARAISGLFGGSVAPGMAQKLLSNIFGSAGMDIVDGLTDLAKSVSKGDVGNGAEKFIGRIGNQFTKPVLNESFDRTQSLFRQAVSKLYEEKTAMLARKDLQAINNQLKYESDPERIQKLKNQRDNILNPFYEKVLNVANNLKDKYGATMTRQRFASILSLMNLEDSSRSAFTGNNGFADETTRKARQQGKAQALETMQRLGFKGADDNSIFGYQKKNQNGEVMTYYQDPVSILSWNSTNNLQDDIHSANISSIFNQKGMYDKKKAIREQVNAIKADWKNKSKKQRSADQEKVDNIWINWNAEVMKEIAPYVARYGAEETINNTKVMTELAKQIELPSSYESNNRGRRVYSSTLGDDGNLKDAYIKSYIRRVFQVNNTGYQGGKDYSGRNK